MAIKRKSHNLDEDLLKRAKRTLKADTETETIHQALKAILLGDEIIADLAAARRPSLFRPEFVRRMRKERRTAG